MPTARIRSALSRIPLGRALIALGVVLVGINVCAAIWDIRKAHERTERRALRDFSNMTRLVAEQTAASLDSVDLILRAVQTNLGRHDFRVETASTAQEALDAVARVHPDLVLLDLGLPDMDGLEVLQMIRKRGNTPVVVLSSRGAERDKVVATGRHLGQERAQG